MPTSSRRVGSGLRVGRRLRTPARLSRRPRSNRRKPSCASRAGGAIASDPTRPASRCFHGGLCPWPTRRRGCLRIRKGRGLDRLRVWCRGQGRIALAPIRGLKRRQVAEGEKRGSRRSSSIDGRDAGARAGLPTARGARLALAARDNVYDFLSRRSADYGWAHGGASRRREEESPSGPAPDDAPLRGDAAEMLRRMKGRRSRRDAGGRDLRHVPTVPVPSASCSRAKTPSGGTIQKGSASCRAQGPDRRSSYTHQAHGRRRRRPS